MNTSTHPKPHGPEQVGPFEVLEPIARGGNAVVHVVRWSGAASDPRDDLVAKIAVAGAELSLHAENTALRSVEHPNVIAPVGFVDDMRRVALVLPRAVCSLRAHSGRLDEHDVAPAVAALAGGLAELHRAGYSHGDVSAGNVLLFADGRAALSDLGRAAAVSSAAAGADVAGLARAGLESLRTGSGGALQDLLRQVVEDPCDAGALRECIEALGIEPRTFDVTAAPPLVVEPPTMIVE